MTMLEKKLGRKVAWERDAEGRVQIPLELAQNPDLGVDRYAGPKSSIDCQ